MRKAKIEIEIEFETESDHDTFPESEMKNILMRNLLSESSVFIETDSNEKQNVILLNSYTFKKITFVL